MQLINLPVELILLIAEHLISAADINSFTQTNCYFCRILDPYLYQYSVRFIDGSALLWASEQGQDQTHGEWKREEYGVLTTYDFNQTPVSITAVHRCTAALEVLRQKGVDLETEDLDGRTPLLIAAVNGHEPIVKLLLDKGA